MHSESAFNTTYDVLHLVFSAGHVLEDLTEREGLCAAFTQVEGFERLERDNPALPDKSKP